MAGIPIDQAADMLATDPATLRRVYHKFDPTYLRPAVAAVEFLYSVTPDRMEEIIKGPKREGMPRVYSRRAGRFSKSFRSRRIKVQLDHYAHRTKINNPAKSWRPVADKTGHWKMLISLESYRALSALSNVGTKI